MKLTAGIDVGSTYTKAVVLGEDGAILGRAVEPTGFRLAEVAEQGKICQVAIQTWHLFEVS